MGCYESYDFKHYCITYRSIRQIAQEDIVILDVHAHVLREFVSKLPGRLFTLAMLFEGSSK